MFNTGLFNQVAFGSEKKQEISVQVSDSITTFENVTFLVSVDSNGTDNVVVYEIVNLVLDVLYVDVLDPFHCTVTEHVDVIDLMVEIGVVMEGIYGNEEYIELYIDNLYLSVLDDSTVIEELTVVIDILFCDGVEDILIEYFLSVSVSRLNTECFEDVTCEETSNIFIDTLYPEVSDDITVFESVEVFDIIIELYAEENITVEEYFYFGFEIILLDIGNTVTIGEVLNIARSILYVNVQDEYGVLITEHIDIVDLMVEIGVVATFVYTQEWTYLYLNVLVPFAPDMPFTFVQHTVDEYVALVLSIAISVEDSVTAGEQAQAYEGIAFSFNSQITAQEIIIIVRDYEIVKTDAIYIEENVTLLEESAPATFSINVFDQISVTYSRELYLDTLFLSVLNQITVFEYFNLIDLVVEIDLLIQNITVLDSAGATVVYTSILSFSVFDTVSWLGDFVTLKVDRLLSVNDNVWISESVNLTDLEIDVPEVFDEIIIEEYVETAYSEFDIPEMSDTITVGEEGSVAYSEIDIDTYDEVYVDEFIHIPEPSEDGTINVGDDILAEEVAEVYLNELFVDLYDEETIWEEVVIAVRELLIIVEDSVFVYDIFVTSVLWSINIYNSVSVSELAYLVAEGFIPRPPQMFDFHRYPSNSVTFEYESRAITLPY